MRQVITKIGVSVLACALAACSKEKPAPQPPNPPSMKANAPAEPDTWRPVASGNTPAAADIAAVAALNATFDPKRDPASDLEMAKVEAQRGGKRILLEVGGDWCVRCPVLDKLVEGDAELRSLRDANFVWVKVHYSADQPNQPFLSQYPPIQTYPHLFVLDASGALLHTQPTGGLEKGEGYDRAKFLALLKQWAPAQP
jgi:thioredoxin-related protein